MLYKKILLIGGDKLLRCLGKYGCPRCAYLMIMKMKGSTVSKPIKRCTLGTPDICKKYRFNYFSLHDPEKENEAWKYYTQTWPGWERLY